MWLIRDSKICKQSKIPFIILRRWYNWFRFFIPTKKDKIGGMPL